MFRSFLVALLVLALIPTSALANTSVWAGRTVLDRAAFSGAIDRALDDPGLEAEVAERLAGELFAALIEADDRARLVLVRALGISGDSSDREIRNVLRARVAGTLDDPRTVAARQGLIGDAYDAIRGTERPGSAVRIVGDHFVLELRPMLQAVVDSLETGLAMTIPPTASTEITLPDSPGLATARDGLSTLERLVLILPLTALLLALLVVLVAHRRAKAVGTLGVVAIIAGLVGIGIVLFGGVVLGRSGAELEPALVDGTIGEFGSVLLIQSAALVGAGLALAFVGAVGSARGSGSRDRRAAAVDDW